MAKKQPKSEPVQPKVEPKEEPKVEPKVEAAVATQPPMGASPMALLASKQPVPDMTKVELNPRTKELEVRQASTRVLHEGQPVNEILPTVPVKPPKEGQLTFEMYCSARKVPVMNKAGMRAFTQLQVATLSEWDRVFAAY